MQDIASLLQSLESTDASVRDAAALDLMDIGDERAVAPLLRAISKPENVNHRGTLVYALSAFDCREFIETLVHLALTGNYEVAAGACNIINDMATSEDCLQRIKAQLQQIDPEALQAEHHQWAWEELLELAESMCEPDGDD